VGSVLRTPFFIVALIALVIAFLLELGSGLVTGGDSPSNGALQSAVDEGLPGGAADDVDLGDISAKETRPGLGIRYLAFLDGLLLLTVGLMAISLLLPERVHGRLQGWITLMTTAIGAFVIFFFGILVIALPLLLTMVGLFLAAPFGTIAYLAVWGFFDRGGAAAVLGLILFLKLAFAILLVLAHERFLQNKGLVMLIVTSLVANLLLSFLHGFVPGILVSITDALGAIVIAALALIWAIVFFFGALAAVVKSLKLEKSSA
jgi:hypothetical protein